MWLLPFRLIFISFHLTQRPTAAKIFVLVSHSHNYISLYDTILNIFYAFFSFAAMSSFLTQWCILIKYVKVFVSVNIYTTAVLFGLNVLVRAVQQYTSYFSCTINISRDLFHAIQSHVQFPHIHKHIVNGMNHKHHAFLIQTFSSNTGTWYGMHNVLSGIKPFILLLLFCCCCRCTKSTNTIN